MSAPRDQSLHTHVRPPAEPWSSDRPAAPRSPGTVLYARDLVKSYGGTRVLRGASVTLDTSDVHVIEGANGSGKTTLLGALGGRMLPSSGVVRLEDAGRVVAEGKSLRSAVGWLGHELGLYPDLTAAENIALHLRLRGLDPHDGWGRLAAEVNITGLADRRVRQLSRGQRQRVALARALVGAPQVVLLDEPSTGLDTTSLGALANLLRGRQRKGTIVVVVTHDAALCSALSGKAWKMERGVMVEVGSALASGS